MENTKTTSRPYRFWTMPEVNKAAGMWNDGMSAPEISRVLNRSLDSLSYLMNTNRDKFPRRSDTRVGVGRPKDGTSFHLRVSKKTAKGLREEAKSRNMPVSSLIRELIASARPDYMGLGDGE